MRQVMKAAWRLPASQGEARLEKEAQALEKDHPSAAASLREGLAEMFTVSRLGLPAPLSRGLCSTNVIESSFWGARSKTRRGDALARRFNGLTLGRGQLGGHGEKLPQAAGLQTALDAQSLFGRTERRPTGRQQERRIGCFHQELLATFNCERDNIYFNGRPWYCAWIN